ncbi:unnamed protein product [Brugia timori]|uniref:Uncharacterized protein n=1 Tax=Brugia timori TaxID=42155 RepID=A0A3P7SK61_9BILA|nr:unnamed protein product [Brugia timori]
MSVVVNKSIISDAALPSTFIYITNLPYQRRKEGIR